MSEQVNENVNVEQPAAAAPAEQQSESIDINEMRAGYLVGLDPKGDFVFRIFGKEQGVVELTGVHAYAGRRLNDAVDAREGRNTAVVVELGKLVVELDRKVTQLLNKVDPPKPDNQL